MNIELTTPKEKGRARKVIDAIRKRNKGLFPDERSAKYCKMATDPLVFYRGTDHLFWDDFSKHSQLSDFGNAKTRTWLQGDLHAFNYGSFGNADGDVVYDLNDFDETVQADYQFDLWRMAVSIVLVARQNDDLTPSQQRKVVDSFSHTYLDTLSAYRKKKYDKDKKLPCHDRKDAYGNLARFLKSVEQEYSRKIMLDKWAPVEKGKRKFDIEGREDKLRKTTSEQDKALRKAMADYRKTLKNGPSGGDSYFKVKDTAQRIGAGTGSLGTPRFYVLIQASKNNDPDKYRILDVKQQSKPAPYPFLDKASRREYDKEFGNNSAQRHAVGYRALTCRTDSLLGWMHLKSIEVRSEDGSQLRDADGYYSVRERSPFKEAFPTEALDTRTAFSVVAEQWAEILATDHARANRGLPDLVRDNTKGKEDAFLGLMRKIAFSYAEQVGEDWKTFRGVLKSKESECNELAFVPPSYRDMLPR